MTNAHKHATARPPRQLAKTSSLYKILGSCRHSGTQVHQLLVEPTSERGYIDSRTDEPSKLVEKAKRRAGKKDHHGLKREAECTKIKPKPTVTRAHSSSAARLSNAVLIWTQLLDDTITSQHRAKLSEAKAM
ncbi:hypothetical protein Y032_0152g2877 [Ancylostoma ceylanicum]|uniref:Uncharacterized protein n=1 Tax=Ancylostoma ceylanicum TaxID=53326 RepID=A0A016SZS9_9BILA|nr:hypothetical protein Y032_0152g2877 [Ancylostoma ceylanicum]